MTLMQPCRFTADDGQTVDAEAGRLVVPENRSAPDRRTIDLAFVRFASTAANPGPPIVYLAGGPGGSGIATARGPRFHLFMAMRAAGDVIALDQRGVGLSRPNLEIPEEGRIRYPLDQPADRMEMTRLYRERARACVQFWTDQGVDLSAYNTVENAGDVDALREALGAAKISLWSTSYGTHLAQAVLRRHGPRVHRAILAGAEGPDHTLKLPSTVQADFEALAALYRSDPHVGPLLPDLIGLLNGLLARLEAEPVVVPVRDPQAGQEVAVTVGPFDLQLYLAGLSGRIASIQTYPAAFLAMARGDFTSLGRAALSIRSLPLYSAMSCMMDCSSGVSAERYERIQREEAEFPLAAAVNFPFPEFCDAWGSPDLGPEFRAPVRSSVPTLFISGALDGRTPASNAEEIRQGFADSTHVILENTAHGDHLLLSTPRTGELMVQFMRGEPVADARIPVPPPPLDAVGS